MSIRMDPAVEEVFGFPDEEGDLFRVGRVEEGGDVGFRSGPHRRRGGILPLIYSSFSSLRTRL